VVKYRVGIVRTNLSNAFPNKTKAELRSIENKFYRHLTDLMLETIKGMTITKKNLLLRMRLADPDFFKKQLDNQQSTIIVMSHCGNWEWVCLAAQISVEQHAQCVYKTLSSPDWDHWFFQLRSRFGTAPFTMEKTLRVMTSNAHLITATAFIGDQNPSSGKNAYWTTFLNQETCFMTGSEKIARKMDHDVAYMSIQKEKRGYYVCHLEMLSSDPKQTKEGEITELIVRATEKDIIHQPHNWLWSHRRWKHKKED
jgi:Kdo2-lipid IVA lauroyltransferase/acyltransferase